MAKRMHTLHGHMKTLSSHLQTRITLTTRYIGCQHPPRRYHPNRHQGRHLRQTLKLSRLRMLLRQRRHQLLRPSLLRPTTPRQNLSFLLLPRTAPRRLLNAKAQLPQFSLHMILGLSIAPGPWRWRVTVGLRSAGRMGREH